MRYIGMLPALLLLTSGSLLGAVRFNRRFEELMPVTLMAIIPFLFLFYVFDILLVGFYVLLAALLGCAVYSVVYMIIQKSYRQTARNFFTPAAAVWTALLAVVFLATRNNVPLVWDELRLWAALPKALYMTDALQLGPNSPMYAIMQPYIPGIALFQYFWLKITGAFSDGQLFFAYALFGLSLFLPALKNLRWKHWAVMPLIAVALFVSPLLYFNTDKNDSCFYYISLYVDPNIALLLASGIFLLFAYRMRGAYSYIMLSLTAASLVLLKDDGLLFAAVLVIAAAVITRKMPAPCPDGELQTVKTEKKGRTARMLLAAALPVCCFFIWKLTLLSHAASTETLPLSLAFPGQQQFAIAGKFILALFTKKVINSNFNMLDPVLTYATMAGLTIVGTILIYSSLKKAYRKPFMYASAAFYAGNIAYLFGLMLLYIYRLGERLPSFSRYVSVVLAANTIFLILVLIHLMADEHFDGMVIRKRFIKSTALLAALSLVIFPLRQPHVRVESKNLWIDSKMHAETIRRASEMSNKPVNVYLVIGGDEMKTSLLHQQIYYALLDNGLYIRNFLTETDVTGADGQEAYEDWNKALIDGKYSYVYLVKDDPVFTSQFSQMFIDPIQKETLYRVDAENGRAQLRKAGN